MKVDKPLFLLLVGTIIHAPGTLSDGSSGEGTLCHTGTSEEVFAACNGKCCDHEGSNACWWSSSRSNTVCEGSCLGEAACHFNTGVNRIIHAGSCNSNRACYFANALEIGMSSCNADNACTNADGESVGSGSCNKPYSCNHIHVVVGDCVEDCDVGSTSCPTVGLFDEVLKTCNTFSPTSSPTTSVRPATIPGTPLGFSFTFALFDENHRDREWRAASLHWDTPLVMEQCLAEDTTIHQNCGADLCISIRERDRPDKTLRVSYPDMQLYLLDKKGHGDAYQSFSEDASFCLRAGKVDVHSFALETANNPGHFVYVNRDNNFLFVQPAEKTDARFASFWASYELGGGHSGSDGDLTTTDTMCSAFAEDSTSIGLTCAAGFFCHNDICHVQRGEDQTCTKDGQCHQDGSCQIDMIGDLLNGGYFDHVCKNTPLADDDNEEEEEG